MTAEHITGASLVDWRLALQNELPLLATSLQEGSDPYAASREIGLPTPPEFRYASVPDFLEHGPQGVADLQAMGITAFYVALRPLDAAVKKYREMGLTAPEALAYPTAHVREQDHHKYIVQLAEYAPAQYGATIIINTEGHIHLEMVAGEMAKLATGEATPTYTAHSDPFTNVMRYSFDDPELRQAVWQAIRHIPHSNNDSSFRRFWQPGYYEFSLIDRNDCLTPVFFDYKTNIASI